MNNRQLSIILVEYEYKKYIDKYEITQNSIIMKYWIQVRLTYAVNKV